MAVRNDFAAGEVLAAADLNDTFASKLPYSYGTATPSTTDSGFLWYDSNSTPAAPKFWDGAAFQALTSGKILQVVRATDSTQRDTSSTSFTDVTGASVTITPQKSDSAVLILAFFRYIVFGTASTNRRGSFQISDNSNNAISGAEDVEYGQNQNDGQDYGDGSLLAYATPATTSAVTYKLRFKTVGTGGNVVRAANNLNTLQMFAIEVSA